MATSSTSEDIKATFPYSLADLSSVRSYNYDQPTICHDVFIEKMQCTKSSTFCTHFYKMFPFLSNALGDLVVFGGCIVDFLLLNSHGIRDVDMLLLENDSTREKPGIALAKRVEKFVEDIKKWVETEDLKDKTNFDRHHYSCPFVSKYPLNDLLVTRYKDVYEVKLPWCDVKFQISYCRSLDELSKNIDIGCTQVIMKDNTIYMGKKAKFELENLAITVDHRRQYNQYFERIIKYFEKGFDLILPYLDIDKVPSRNLAYKFIEILDLTFILVSCSKISKNKIIGLPYLRDIDKKQKPANTMVSDWGSGKRKSDVSKIIHENLCKIARNDTGCLTYWGEGENYTNAFLPNVTVTERQLTNTYASVSKRIFKNNAIDMEILEEYYPIQKLSSLMQEMIVEYLSKPDTTFGDAEFKNHVNEYIESLTELQIEAIRSKISAIDKSKELTLSESPAFIFEKEDDEYLKSWYGIYLKQVEVV